VYKELRKGMQLNFSCDPKKEMPPNLGACRGKKRVEGNEIQPELTRGIEPLTC
jgi:hypothetical protein